MGRAEKMDCRVNGDVILTGATTEFQLKKGLTPNCSVCLNSIYTKDELGYYLQP
jgi:hypothetical protein